MNDRLERLWPFVRPDNPIAPIRGKKRHIEVALKLLRPISTRVTLTGLSVIYSWPSIALD